MSDKKLGTKVTEFLKLKQKIKKKNVEVEDLKAIASVLEGEIIKGLENGKIERSDVALGSVSLKKSNVWSAKDWDKIWKYILKNKDKALLQKRLSQATFNEYLEEGVKIPGTEKLIKKTLSVGYKRGV